MLKKRKEKIIILVSLIIVIVNLFTLQKKKYSYKSKIETQIAKAICILEQDEEIEKNVDRKSFPIEYNFLIKNFDEYGNVNEVDLDYKIKIETSVNNFPIKYKLIDSDKNIELPMDNSESSTLHLLRYEKEIKNYKLYVEWNDIGVDLADEVEIKLKVEAIQSKEKIDEKENNL